jgi:hypothetical protein
MGRAKAWGRSLLASTWLLALSGGASHAGPPPADAETKAWWALTQEISSDAMEGRDTGSPGYDRAATVWRSALPMRG